MFRKTIFGLLLTAILVNYASLGVYSSSAQKDNDIFAKRRSRLMDQLNDGIIVFKTDKYNQDFYYLTGIEKVRAAFILIPGDKKKFILFINPSNSVQTQWTGRGLTVEDAKERYGADAVHSLDKFEGNVLSYIRRKHKIYYNFSDEKLNETLIRFMKMPSDRFPIQTSNSLSFIHEMRLIKNREEQNNIKKACDITCDALQSAIKTTKPGMYEYEIEAVIEYVFRKNGASGPGFPSIVGSGQNSTVLHYEDNNSQLHDNDMMVMDVGAEYNHYTADVTRTIPVNGKFTPPQRELYEIVLKAQKAAFNTIKPGRDLREIHLAAEEAIKEGLFKIGFITDLKSPWQTRLFSLYNTNHWLGLDVHDVGGRGKNFKIGKILKPGMVFTVEPGIYISWNLLNRLKNLRMPNVDQKKIDEYTKKITPLIEKYLNIGIRIEDDVLVTETGYVNLSNGVPKSIKEIERLMQK